MTNLEYSKTLPLPEEAKQVIAERISPIFKNAYYV
jgi:hypothetical protein